MATPIGFAQASVMPGSGQRSVSAEREGKGKGTGKLAEAGRSSRWKLNVE